MSPNMMKKSSCFICVVLAIHHISALVIALPSGTSIFLLRTSRKFLHRKSLSKESASPVSKSSKSLRKKSTPPGERRRSESLSRRKSEASSGSKKTAKAEDPLKWFIVSGTKGDFQNDRKPVLIKEAGQIQFNIPTSTVVVDLTGFSKERQEVTAIRVRDVEKDGGDQFFEVELIYPSKFLTSHLTPGTGSFTLERIKLSKKIPNGFQIADKIGKDEDRTAVHIAVDGETPLDINDREDIEVTFDNFCVAYIKFIDLHGAEPIEIYPYVDMVNNHLKVSFRTSLTEPPKLTSHEIPSHCVIEDEFPLLSAVLEPFFSTFQVKGKKKNVMTVEDAPEIIFQDLFDNCLCVIDLNERIQTYLNRGVTTVETFMVPLSADVGWLGWLDGIRRAEVLMEFSDRSSLLLTKEIPPYCAISSFGNLYPNSGDCSQYDNRNNRNVCVRYETQYGKIKLTDGFHDKFLLLWASMRIIVDQSCLVRVNLAGHMCQTIKTMSVGLNVDEDSKSYHLSVMSGCNSEILQLFFPEPLKCAFDLSPSGLSIKENARGFYTAKVGTPLTTVMIQR